MAKGYMRGDSLQRLSSIKPNLSGVGSHILHERLGFAEKGSDSHKQIIGELKKRNHLPGSKWAKENL